MAINMTPNYTLEDICKQLHTYGRESCSAEMEGHDDFQYIDDIREDLEAANIGWGYWPNPDGSTSIRLWPKTY
jgi:hypothetical protein